MAAVADRRVRRPRAAGARSARVPRRITADSRRVEPGDAFVAFPGAHADGRDFVADALARGAGAVLWETQRLRVASRMERRRTLPVDEPAARGSARSPTSSTAARRRRCGSSASPAPTARPRARSGSRKALDRCGRRARGRSARSATASSARSRPRRTPRPTRRALHATARAVQGGGRARGRDRGLVARPRPGPRQRRRVRRRAVHQPHARPSRLSRHDGRLRRGQGAALRLAGPARAVINVDDAFGQRLADGARARGRERADLRSRATPTSRATGDRQRERAASRCRCRRRGARGDVTTRADRRLQRVRTCSACLGVLLASDMPLDRRARRALARSSRRPAACSASAAAARRSSSSTTRTRPTRSRRC